MKPPPQVARDLDQLLTAALGCASPLDELSLLRVALRRYIQSGDPAEAVAWAAETLGAAFTRTLPYDHRRLRKE